MGPSKEKKISLTVLFVILGLEIINLFPDFIFLILIILSAGFIFALFKILEITPKDKILYPVLAFPLVLLIEAAIFLNVIPLFSAKHIFILIFAILLYLVVFALKSIKQHIVSYSVIIFNILTIAYLVSILFAYVIIFNLELMYEIPLWANMLLVGIATFLFFLFHLWKNDILSKEAKIYNLLLTMIIVEFFWALSFWPLFSLSLGFVLFLAYYILSGLFTFSLKKSLKKEYFLSHITVPAIVLVAFLFSCKW